LLDPAADAKISTLEIFGPVVAVYRYGDLDEAIARANSLPTAFQASVFAQDIDVAMRAANRLEASAVMINDPSAFRTDWMPFAGRKQSGYGTGGIPRTMRDLPQEKMILMHRSRPRRQHFQTTLHRAANAFAVSPCARLKSD